jgi:ectoine hydroxylase-related dioxygenase (phytanoyl-CoA dioxygenase family)
VRKGGPGEDLGREFRENGFVKVEGMFSAADVAEFKEEIRRILDAARERAAARGDAPGSVAADGVYVGLAAGSDYFRQVARDERLLDALEPILGPNIEFLSDKVVFKAADVDYGSPWHQDWPYWGGAHKISAWIALDPATPENGCLKLLPGSHLHSAPHANVDAPAGEGFGLRLKPGEVDESQAVLVPAAPGDAVLFHDLTLHASFPNHSGRDRWALISTYRSASEPDLAYDWAVAAEVVRGKRTAETIRS